MSQNNGVVLFVDDEAFLTEIGREMLEDFGHRVDVATHPKEALELVKNDSGRYALAIVDYTMPDMNGIELVEQIHAVRPGLPAILCSGTRLLEEINVGNGIQKVMIKPYNMEDLADIVARILGGQGNA